MPRPVLEHATDLWGPKFVQYYSQTEAPLCVTVLSHEDHADTELWDSCGHPMVTAEVAVTDDDGNRVDVGEIGEVRVRTPTAMSRYHNEPELTAESKTPKSVRFADDLTKSPVGKILRRALRDPLWADQPQPAERTGAVSWTDPR